MYFKDAVRAVVRDRGPPRRAPIVLLETLLEGRIRSVCSAGRPSLGTLSW